MLFIGDFQNKDLSVKISKSLGLECNYPDIHVFADTEKRVRILQEVVDKDILLFKSLSAPVDGNVVELCLLIDALKRNGARQITGVIPYFPYQRADHIFRVGEAVPLEVVIKMVESAGLTKIIIADPHSIKIPEMFLIPITDVSAIPVFAEKIKEIRNSDLSNVTVVSPDMGGIRRIKLLSEALNGVSYVAINKDRDLETGSVAATKHEGQINEVCFIVDDIVSTGHTVVEAVDYLIDHGAKLVYIMATHAVLSENASEIMQGSSVEKVFVTDAVFVPDEKKFEKLEILSISDLLVKAIKEK